MGVLAAQWNKFIRSRTEDEYSEKFTNLSKTWTTQTADYILENWIPLKTKFVGTYIDSHCHFGNTVTSRVEGLHSYIKTFISSSSSSFAAILCQIDRAITIQISERFIESTQQTLKNLLGLPPSLENLNISIPHHALKIVHSFHRAKKKQQQLALELT